MRGVEEAGRRGRRALRVWVSAMMCLGAFGPAGGAPACAGGFDTRAVFGGADVRECDGSGDPDIIWTCLRATMLRHGASPEAVAFAWQLAQTNEWGWMSAYRWLGTIGLATVTHPFRARSKDVTMLLARGAFIDVDAYLLSSADRSRPDLATVIRSHPQANVWPAMVLRTEERLGNGGTRLLFTAQLGDCHTCEPYGTAEIVYTFDGAGRLARNGLVAVATH